MEDHGRIRVLLADDHRILREALRMVLATECEVVAEASNGEQAVAIAAQLKPDVVVMDIGMPGIGGLSAARRIAKEAPACKVLVLSQYDDEEYVLEALGEAGCAGYIVKTDAAAELLSAVRAVHSGRRYLSPTIAPIVLARLNSGRACERVARGESDQARARSAQADRRGRDYQGGRATTRHQRQDRAGPSRQPQAEARAALDGGNGAIRDQAQTDSRRLKGQPPFFVTPSAAEKPGFGCAFGHGCRDSSLCSQ